MLIPLTNEVLGECIDYEKKWLAGLDSQGAKRVNEEKQARTRIEKLYDLACKRDSQNAGKRFLHEDLISRLMDGVY